MKEILDYTEVLKRLLGYVLIPTVLLASATPNALPAETRSAAEEAAASVGIHGGLCAQVGGGGSAFAAPLAGTGRFLVHVLCPTDKAIEKARAELGAQGLYGLASIDRLDAGGRLPYTENVVNLLVIPAASTAPVSLAEVKRVLCPDGVLLAAPGLFTAAETKAAGLSGVPTVQAEQTWVASRKPRPAEMDQWSHARHSASGNPVSTDTLVAPPRRVRWVVGAQAEVAGIVTSAGCNFYGAALARDGFNGLRLWSRDLVDPSASGQFVMKRLPPVIPPPIAVGPRLFAVAGNTLVALNAATGRQVREYPEAGQPRLLLHDDGILGAK